VVKKNAQTLLALINDILDLSKIEAGRAEVVQELVNFRELGPGLLGHGARVPQGKEVEITHRVDERVFLVRTDGLKLRQVLLNLLSNAAKFTDSGEIALSAQVEDGMAVIRIEDTGIGIPPDQLPFIFEKFRQVDGSSTRTVGGHGAGAGHRARADAGDGRLGVGGEHAGARHHLHGEAAVPGGGRAAGA
jgi:signal transduction histidine kinase